MATWLPNEWIFPQIWEIQYLLYGLFFLRNLLVTLRGYFGPNPLISNIKKNRVNMNSIEYLISYQSKLIERDSK